MMAERVDAYNPRGVELFCDIIRGEIESHPCPACGQALDQVDIQIREVADDLIRLELTCGYCRKQFTIGAMPASGEGVAVVG